MPPPQQGQLARFSIAHLAFSDRPVVVRFRTTCATRVLSGVVRIAKDMIMGKDDMINCLLLDIELDRFRVADPDQDDNASLSQRIESEWSRLNALSYGEIEARYLKSEELYTMSA